MDGLRRRFVGWDELIANCFPLGGDRDDRAGEQHGGAEGLPVQLSHAIILVDG
jgi:hypothetical protein